MPRRVTDPRPPAGSISYLQMQSVVRMIVLKVMYENKIDVFVNPEQTTPPYLLGGALEPEVNDRGTQSCCQRFTALLGSPEADVPAGYVTTTYDPKYVLSDDKTEYIAVTGDVEVEAPASHADQHDVLGRSRQRLRRHQSRIGI